MPSLRTCPFLHPTTEPYQVPYSDISSLREELEGIVNERKNRFRRFFSAKRHRNELQDVVNQLEMARSNYTVRRFDPQSHAVTRAHEACI